MPYVLIADLDYLKEIGDERVKNLFAMSARAVKDNVIDATSTDAASLIDRIEEAIQTGRRDDLQATWEYIKARQNRMRTDLSTEEEQLVTAFIASKRASGTVVLRRGALESYLPDGYRRKDLDKLIRLCSMPDVWDQLPNAVKPELEEIISGIQV